MTDTVTDPVCGMEIRPDDAVVSEEHWPGLLLLQRALPPDVPRRSSSLRPSQRGLEGQTGD